MTNLELGKVNVISEGLIRPSVPVTIHLAYNKALTLKELSEILDLINKASNDINRQNGIRNNYLLSKEYAPLIASVNSGSITLQIFFEFASSVAAGLLASCIYDKFKTLGAKKKNDRMILATDNSITIIVNGNDNLIDINITKPD